MASGNWLLTTGGSWNNNANWSGASFPNATTDTATFATDIAADSTVTMGQALSVGSMTFSDNGASGSAWVVAPGGAFALTLGASTITTTTNATIQAALAGSSAITKAGAAILALTGGSSNSGAWAINAGTLDITSAAVTGGGIITVAGGATLTTATAIAKPVTVNGVVSVNSGGSLTGQQIYASAAGAVAKVTIASGGSITHPASKFDISTSTSGRTAVYQYGNVSTTGTTTTYGISLGFGAASTAYAYWYGKSGTLTTTAGPYLLVGLSYTAGTTLPGGSPSVMDIDGATLALSGRFFIGNSITSSAAVHILQGTHTQASGFSLNIGGSELGTNITSGSAEQRFSVSGASTTFTSAAPVTMTANSASALSQINVLNGATLTVAGGSTSGATPKQINLNNGSIFKSTASFTTAGGSFNLSLYGTSNKIGAGSGTAVLPAIIQNTTGNGVTSIPITPGNEGADYIGAPVVVLTGGGGVGASARAVWDETTKKITSFEITNPGTGYTSPPTVVLSGATLANNCCTVEVVPGTPVIGANSTDGSIEKPSGDTGTLTLTGTNTNTGIYTVSAGTLRIGNAGTTGTLGNGNASNAVIASGATLAFGRSDAVTYSQVFSGAGTIAVNGGGRATLSSVNTFTSAAAAIAISTANSILRVTNNDSIGQGTTFGITVASGTAFEIDGTSGNITGLPAKALSLTGTGITAGGALRNIAGNNTYSGAVTLAAASRINSDAGTLTLNSASAITGATFGLTLGGAGTLEINQAISTTTGGVIKDGAGFTDLKAAASTYTGKTTVSAGTLGYSTAAAAGSNSSLGAPAAGANAIVDVAGAATAGASAGVRFTGAGSQTFTRTLNVTGANAAGLTVRVESSGTGSITHSTAFTNTTTNQPRTYQFGGTGTASNTVSFLIANNGTGAVSLTKADAGTWRLSNTSSSYTGGTSVSGGTLALSIPSWVTGAKVTGTGTVTVNAGAKIQTLSAGTQQGRHTYPNLTFAANGRIRIGG